MESEDRRERGTISSVGGEDDRRDNGGAGKNVPTRRNRAALADSSQDLLGRPIAHVSLKFDFQEVRAIYEHLNAELIRSGLGHMSKSHKKSTGRVHMMGTTRMGNSPKQSCTGAHGRMHGTENLYVAGSSVFLTVGGDGPTPTIVALSLRFVAYLTGKIESSICCSNVADFEGASLVV